jgi:purine-nucleoside phosphorylase
MRDKPTLTPSIILRNKRYHHLSIFMPENLLRTAIEQAFAIGILAVEMEATTLYAFAQARHKPVICFANVTNQTGQAEGNFKESE